MYQLATAFDPTTAAGGAPGAAAAAAGAAGPGVAGPGAAGPGAAGPQLRRGKKVKFIALDKAFPSDYEQAAAAGKPAPGPGACWEQETRTSCQCAISGNSMTRYRDIQVWSR